MKKFFYSLALVNAAIIFLLFISGSKGLVGTGTSDTLLLLGRLTGLYAVYFALLQFVLIGRMPLLEHTFGLDKLARIHHKTGKYAYLLIVLHLLFILGSYSFEAKINLIEQLQEFVTTYNFLYRAYISIILYTIVIFTSLAIVRLKLKYEAWYFVHLLTYIAILLPFMHQIQLGGSLYTPIGTAYWYLIYILCLGQFVVFRFGRPLYNLYKHRFKVVKIVPENYNTTSIYIDGTNLDTFPRKSGQFMIVRFLDRFRFWQAHPFSLSWSSTNIPLRITVKNSGDFTSEIQKVKVGTKVFIDGPHGIFSKQVLSHDKILFVAAGVGITPIRALVEELGILNKDLKLLYSNKTYKDILFEKELNEISTKYKLKTHHILTDELNFKGEKGRIDEEKVARLVPDIIEREVYICGPEPFMDAVIAICLKLGVPKTQIHFEKFSLH